MKSLRLPNGRRTTSDRIQRIEVCPRRSLSRDWVYVVVFEKCGPVFEGLANLNDIECADEATHAGHRGTAQPDGHPPDRPDERQARDRPETRQ